MATRKSLSKKTRFEVFKRDGFTCQYCGSTPPKVILHLDHIFPVSKGGDNGQDNLITSCLDCNLGKAATPLNVIPQSLSEKAKILKEKEAQIKAFYSIMEESRQRIDSEVFKIGGIMGEEFSKSLPTDWHRAIKMFLGKLPFYDVLEAMEISVSAKPYSKFQAFKYFCGVCWNKVRDAENG